MIATICATTGEALGEADITPQCGEHFCDTCGCCIHCYSDCCPGGCWLVIYEESLKSSAPENSSSGFQDPPT